MKVTPWFPAEVKPVRPGWYETFAHSESMKKLRYWDGEKWLYGESPDRHFKQDWTWRGIEK